MSSERETTALTCTSYMEFKFAIASGDLIKVEEVRNVMYKDISLNDVPFKIYPTVPPLRDLLSLCIDNTEARIGKLLLSQGIDRAIKVVFTIVFFSF